MAPPPPAAQPVSPAVPINAETSVTLLTVEEAALRLSLGRTTLYMLLKAGQIDSVRIGRRRRVPVAALAAYTCRNVKPVHRPENKAHARRMAHRASTTGQTRIRE